MLKQFLMYMLREKKKETHQVRQKLYAEDLIKQTKENVAATISVSQEEVYNTLYFSVRDMIKNAMKDGRLTREQILYIKMLLNGFLKPYSVYYNSRYKNDMHEIYSKLKSPFLSNVEYKQISNFILSCIRIY